MVIGLAADRLTATAATGASDRGADTNAVGPFLAPVEGNAPAATADVQVGRDPFATLPNQGAKAVAPVVPGPTVNASRRPARQLTAILIADDRPIAVIDGEVVKVGDVLPDGATVASIREDRVSLRERDGRWRVVTLPAGRP